MIACNSMDVMRISFFFFFKVSIVVVTLFLSLDCGRCICDVSILG